MGVSCWTSFALGVEQKIDPILGSTFGEPPVTPKILVSGKPRGEKWVDAREYFPALLCVRASGFLPEMAAWVTTLVKSGWVVSPPARSRVLPLQCWIQYPRLNTMPLPGSDTMLSQACPLPPHGHQELSAGNATVTEAPPMAQVCSAACLCNASAPGASTNTRSCRKQADQRIGNAVIVCRLKFNRMKLLIPL